MGNNFFDFSKYWPKPLKNFRIEIWRFSFQICFRNQFLILKSGQTENPQICVFADFPFDHFPKSRRLKRIEVSIVQFIKIQWSLIQGNPTQWGTKLKCTLSMRCEHSKLYTIHLTQFVSRPGRSQGLLYNHLCHWLIHWLIKWSYSFTTPPHLNSWR